MKISSYNITDVGYHYIGLRVVSALSTTGTREEQFRVISKNILKYANDKAKKLMLPEPKGTFESVGEKICHELVHLKFLEKQRTSYKLTDDGNQVLKLLNEGKYGDLRKLMVSAHFRTFSNLRTLLIQHLDVGTILRPIVEASTLSRETYVAGLLTPILGEEADAVAKELATVNKDKSPKQIENMLSDISLKHYLPSIEISISLFRSLSDRLISLRLLNVCRYTKDNLSYYKSYSPCLLAGASERWHIKLTVSISATESLQIFFSEPDFEDADTFNAFLSHLDDGLSSLSSYGGYYDVPELRDFVCERMLIPESAFDEGINHVLVKRASSFTTGLRYDGISSRRKPVIRTGNDSIFNLIRRM